jgi:hypothetical protein
MTLENEHLIIRDLGDGLVLRRASPQDAERLSRFNAWIHRDEEGDEPNPWVGGWTRDLLERPHPTFDPGDFILVEDQGNGQIVSTLNLIDQTWSYGQVKFRVGRPELVGTHPDYRHKGLVRAQFEVIHRWSAERGQQVQAITGIPYYYRQFGYEMAMNLGGGRSGYLPNVPKLEAGQEEPYRVRPAVEADLGFISNLYQQGNQRSLVSCVRDMEMWRYELLGKGENNLNRQDLRVIESREGEPVGYLAHPPFNHDDGLMLAAVAYEVKATVSWVEVTPSVIRYLVKTGQGYRSEKGEKGKFGAFGFWLGAEHPVYEFFSDRLPKFHKPYAWFLRAPDLVGFLKLLIPVLDERLVDSSLAAHTGELKLSFYRHGLRMNFERGRLIEIEPWQPEPHGHSGQARFPDLTFLQLLFGYRSLDELAYAYPDCSASNGLTRELLNSLFPKQPSDLWPIA